MNAAIVLAIALSTPGAEVTESSGTGCSLLLRFDAPVPVDAPGGGWYMEIPGVPLLFAPGQVVIPVERLYIPVPPGAEPGMEFSIRTGLSGNIPGGRPYRTPGLAGSGLETVEVPVEPVGGPGATVEYRGVIPLAGSQYAVLDVYPWL